MQRGRTRESRILRILLRKQTGSDDSRFAGKGSVVPFRPDIVRRSAGIWTKLARLGGKALRLIVVTGHTAEWTADRGLWFADEAVRQATARRTKDARLRFPTIVIGMKPDVRTNTSRARRTCPVVGSIIPGAQGAADTPDGNPQVHLSRLNSSSHSNSPRNATAFESDTRARPD